MLSTLKFDPQDLTVLLKNDVDIHGDNIIVTPKVEKQLAFTITRYGGGFIRKLWEAYLVADQENSRKILNAFNSDFVKYLKMPNRD